jgi:CheY-like chemotaxis protein
LEEDEKDMLKTLIAEDDFTCRLVLQEFLKNYGAAHIAVNGHEAVDAVLMALEARVFCSSRNWTMATNWVV